MRRKKWSAYNQCKKQKYLEKLFYATIKKLKNMLISKSEKLIFKHKIQSKYVNNKEIISKCEI